MEKEYLIKKWLNDELTPAELEMFKALDDYQFYVDIVNNAKHFKASEVATVSDFETFKERHQSETTKVKRLTWFNPYIRIAGILVLALGLYFTFFNDSTTQVKTLAHQKTMIHLPDNSTVTLNALSEIQYDKNSWNDIRSLKLEGEAYFEVEKGKTFDVITSDGVVSVLGTTFNVKQRKHYFEVICFEGIVKVVSNNRTETLTAGKTFRVVDGNFSQKDMSLKEPQWIKNISRFEAVPFKEVIAEMERQYDIKIELENSLENPIFTGGFVHDNLNDALMSITQPVNLTYKIISPKQAVIYGHKK